MKKGFVTHCDDVPQGMVDVAERRIMPLLHDWRLIDYDLKLLLYSCYLQGCRDMTIAIINKEKDKNG